MEKNLNMDIGFLFSILFEKDSIEWNFATLSDEIFYFFPLHPLLNNHPTFRFSFIFSLTGDPPKCFYKCI